MIDLPSKNFLEISKNNVLKFRKILLPNMDINHLISMMDLKLQKHSVLINQDPVKENKISVKN